MRCGVIGLGAMGRAMAVNLYQAGRLQAVWNRTPAKAAQFVAHHPVVNADSPAALAAQCDLIITSLARDADVVAVMNALLPGLQADAVVVDTSTISIDSVRQLADRVRQAGGHFLDAPVSGGPEGARNASLAIMLGGEASVVERVRPVLSTIAAHITHLGPVGNGQAAKAVNQVMAAGINQAVSEALAFGQALGLPMDKVLEVVSRGAAANWFLQQRGATMLQEKYEPGFKVALHHKDLLLCKALAERHGAQLPTLEMTLIHYARLMDMGYAEQDISALFHLKRGLFQRSNQAPAR